MEPTVQKLLFEMKTKRKIKTKSRRNDIQFNAQLNNMMNFNIIDQVIWKITSLRHFWQKETISGSCRLAVKIVNREGIDIESVQMERQLTARREVNRRPPNKVSSKIEANRYPHQIELQISFSFWSNALSFEKRIFAIFRCAVASLKEGVSVRPSVRPSRVIFERRIWPFLKVKSHHMIS